MTDTVTRDLDFSALQAPLTVAQPVPNDSGSAYTAFMPNADLYQFSFDSVAPFVHTVLPVNARRSTDRYDVGVIVDLAADSTVGFDAVQAVPTAVTAPATNLLDQLVADTAAGLAVTWNKVSGASLSASINDANGLAFTSFSEAWQNTFSGDLTFAVPDLTTVEGYPEDGALRTTPDFVQVTAVIETGTFPQDGYEAQVFERSFTSGSPLHAKTRRTIEKARWQERARRAR